MAKTQNRPKTGDKGQHRPKPGAGKKKQSQPWYRATWLPWAVGLVVLVGIAFALRSDETDVPGAGASVSHPVVGDDLHSLVVDPDDPDKIFIGSHQGVSVSSDGGATWEAIESLDGADAMGWGFTDDTILVGGHPGLSVSSDGGETFEQKNDGLPLTDVHALGASGDTIYVGLAGAGLFASSDGGGSWETRSDEFGGSFMGRIHVDASDDQHLLAPDMQGGVVQSNDGGRTWEPLGDIAGAMWVSWAADDTERIVAATQAGAVISTDGGRSWEPLEVPEGASIVEFSPHDPEVLFAAVHEPPEATVYVSRDGGDTWDRP